MVVKRFLSAVLVTGLTLSLAACGGDDSGATGAQSPSTGSTASSTPPPSTPAPGSPTPGTTGSPGNTPSLPDRATPSAPTRTKAALTKALLTLEDLPTGLAIDKSPDEDDDGTGLSSKNRRCADLIRLTDTDTAPGAKVSVAETYSGGEQGPFVDEGLDALASPAAVTALVARLRAAVKACPQATLKIAGVGSSPVRNTEIAVPPVGTSRVGFRVSASSGALEGFQINFVFVALGDVILSMSMDDPSLIEPMVTKAVAKASMLLGTPKAGA